MINYKSYKNPDEPYRSPFEKKEGKKEKKGCRFRGFFMSCLLLVLVLGISVAIFFDTFLRDFQNLFGVNAAEVSEAFALLNKPFDESQLLEGSHTPTEPELEDMRQKVKSGIGYKFSEFQLFDNDGELVLQNFKPEFLYKNDVPVTLNNADIHALLSLLTRSGFYTNAGRTPLISSLLIDADIKVLNFNTQNNVMSAKVVAVLDFGELKKELSSFSFLFSLFNINIPQTVYMSLQFSARINSEGELVLENSDLRFNLLNEADNTKVLKVFASFFAETQELKDIKDFFANEFIGFIDTLKTSYNGVCEFAGNEIIITRIT